MNIKRLAELVECALDDSPIEGVGVKVLPDIVQVKMNEQTAYLHYLGNRIVVRSSCGYSSGITFTHQEPETMAKDAAAFLRHLATHAA